MEIKSERSADETYAIRETTLSLRRHTCKVTDR